jgi:toxin ParE1/3/4
MRIVKSTKFNSQFKEVLYFIALDSESSAKTFKNELIKKVNDLVNMPLKFRQSIYFEDESI